MNKYYQEAYAMKDELTAMRRELHRIPETGLILPKTAAFVQSELAKSGIESVLSPTSGYVTALIGRNDGPCILLRADMDGLPVTEDSGLDFASVNGCMHACGHDCHTTNLLGAAKLLKAHEGELKGRVRLLFQTGEEIFVGAHHAISEGILEDPHVDAAFGMHIASRERVGTIRGGRAVMSSGYCFRIEVTGKGAHGSTPELGISPINTGIHIYLALQELIAREVAAGEEAVLTLGKFESGEVFNVIPEKAVLEGTLRTFNPDVRRYLIDRFHEVIGLVAKAYRSDIEIIVIGDCPAVLNDPDLESEVNRFITEGCPGIETPPTFHWMASEDFSLFGEKVPSCFLSIGGMYGGDYPAYAEHNPKVRFSEESLPVGAGTYATVAAEWLKEHS